MTVPSELPDVETTEPTTCAICFEKLEDDGTCADCMAANLPCRRCGRPRGRRRTDLCVICSDIEEKERFRRTIQEGADAMLRRWEETPHRCVDGCGEKVLREGERCEICRSKRDDERRRVVDASQAMSSVPQRYQWARFKAPELAQRVRDVDAISRVRKAIEDRVDRFLFLGPPGTGKTSLAVAALGALTFARGGPGLFVDTYKLAGARQAHELGSEAPLVRQALEAHVLLLDELGSERAVASSPVPEILHERHADMSVTIVTSGFPLDQLEERYGGGIFRRLVEDAEVIDFSKKGTKG